MTTKQEIPSESKQQVINELKNTRKNIILTSSAFGIAESYLYEYKEQCGASKIVTVTELSEIHSQKKVLDETDLLFYIESILALNLCEQLLQRGMQEDSLQYMKTQLQQNCNKFKFSMGRICNKNYHKGIYLDPILNTIEGKYEWEWLIANFDRPIANAKTIQKSIYQYIQEGPPRVILSAYDRQLNETDHYDIFQVLNLSNQKSYEQLQKEAMMMLYHLYPILWGHHEVIERVLNRLELQQRYTKGEYSYEAFMTGLQKFYEAYHCIEASGCFISEEEFFVAIQDYIHHYTGEISQDQKKKSKLYI